MKAIAEKLLLVSDVIAYNHTCTHTDTLTILLTDLIQINNTSNRFFDVNFGYPSTNRLNKVSIKYIDVIDNQLASQYLIQLAIINLTIHSRLNANELLK